MSKIAFIYPGQGAQKCGMGKDFYEQNPAAKGLFDRAGEILSLDMKALCFEENDKLDITEYTQAALVTTCLAMTTVVRNKGLEPDVTAGLSLGEYCAIAVAGGMSELDAIRTVRSRGIFMQEAVPAGEGAMAAVLGMTGEEIEAVINPMEGVSIANYNCPGQLVITGYTEAVEKASKALKEAGAKRVVPLKVSGPFHSPLLSDAGKKLGEVLETVKWNSLRIPYVTNVTAESIIDIRKTKELLEKQVASSVRWEQSVRNMIADGVTVFVEIGPGKTLSGFLKKIDKEMPVFNIEHLADVDSVVEAIKAM
ncbi:MAG: ACP S-malonyltransferase [Bacteroidales bacterium]|nr:ACP S-malonyltransferase [Lachnoclostridium sp.]MCM1384355.1 ACP S-malonyltransferase [Lachnoclostridium sp.]MCM1464936.1 ACP S-malonyltransferase [Bacteroidales bacterium]